MQIPSNPLRSSDISRVNPDRGAVSNGDFQVSTGGNRHGIVNPLIDVQTWLSHTISSQNCGCYEDSKADEIYDKMLRETNVAKQRALAYHCDKRVLDEGAHYIHSYWRNRLVPLSSYVHGWKVGPSHYANQDLSLIWLAPPKCDECSAAGPNGEKAGRSDSEIGHCHGKGMDRDRSTTKLYDRREGTTRKNTASFLATY